MEVRMMRVHRERERIRNGMNTGINGWLRSAAAAWTTVAIGSQITAPHIHALTYTADRLIASS